MHLAYSAISITGNSETDAKERRGHDLLLRYRAYQATCEKYRREIAAVQKYIPGWLPSPPASV